MNSATKKAIASIKSNTTNIKNGEDIYTNLTELKAHLKKVLPPDSPITKELGDLRPPYSKEKAVDILELSIAAINFLSTHGIYKEENDIVKLLTSTRGFWYWLVIVLAAGIFIGKHCQHNN